MLDGTWRRRADFNGEPLPRHDVKIARGTAFSQARPTIVTGDDLDAARFLFGLAEGTSVTVDPRVDPSGYRYATTYWFVPKHMTRSNRYDADDNLVM